MLAPEWLVGHEIRDARLEVVMSDFIAEPETLPLYAVCAQAAYTPPKIRAFVDFLSGQFSRDDSWAQQH